MEQRKENFIRRFCNGLKLSNQDKDLGDELADVLWVVICLTNQTGVGLTTVFRKNLDKKNLVMPTDITRMKS